MPLCIDCIEENETGDYKRIRESVANFKESTSIDTIASRVCMVSGIPVEDLQLKTRKRDVIDARQLTMYFARKYNRGSLAFIGRSLGGKDHTTVIHAIKTVKNLYEINPEFRNKYKSLFEYYD